MSKRPRVLYLSSWPIGARGEGAVSFVYEQIEALSRHVDAVFVEFKFCSIPEAVWRTMTRRRTSRLEQLWSSGNVKAIRVWVPRMSTRLSRRTLIEDIARTEGEVFRLVTRDVGKIDLIHAHVVLPAGLLGRTMSENAGVPLIVQEHSGPFDMHLDTEEKRAAVHSVLTHASAVIAVSAALARRLEAIGAGPIKMAMIPNLVRTRLFSATPRPAESTCIRLVTVASLVPIKGLQDLLRAVALIRASGQDVRLDIIGDGPLRNVLTREIEELGLVGHVSLLGQLARAEVAQQMGSADTYVCSSHCETFGLAPAEALSVGRPVVSTRCGGPEEFITDRCGVLVPVGDPTSLAEGIRSVWHRRMDFDPSELHEHVEQEFGEGAFTRRMLRLYDQLLAAPPHPLL